MPLRRQGPGRKSYSIVESLKSGLLSRRDIYRNNLYGAIVHFTEPYFPVADHFALIVAKQTTSRLLQDGLADVLRENAVIASEQGPLIPDAGSLALMNEVHRIGDHAGDLFSVVCLHRLL